MSEDPDKRIARDLEERIKRQTKKVEKARKKFIDEKDYLVKLIKQANCDHEWKCTGDFMYIVSTCSKCGLEDSV